MKIGIGTHLDMVVMAKVYFNHVSAISGWAKKHDLILLGTERSKVAAARNQIYASACKEGCTHILFLDGDHLVADNMLDLLLENAAAAMVSGLICKRFFPFPTVAFKRTPDGDLKEAFVEMNGKVIEVDACAMGCTLVNVEMMKMLKRQPPFFDDHFRSDINLCLGFKQLGLKVLLDTRVEVGHLGDAPIITPSKATEMRKRCIDEQMELNNAQDCD